MARPGTGRPTSWGACVSVGGSPDGLHAVRGRRRCIRGRVPGVDRVGTGRTVESRGALVLAAFIGFAVGTLLGWVSYRAVERVAGAWTPGPSVVRVIVFGLAVPAYSAAGLIAIVVGAAMLELPAGDLTATLPALVMGLVVFGVISLPLAAVFGRADRSRPVTLSGALGEQGLAAESAPTSRTFWAFAVAVVMFILGFLPVILLVGLIQDLFGDEALAEIGRVFGPVFGIAIIGLWIISAVVGWKLAMRFIDWVQSNQESQVGRR